MFSVGYSLPRQPLQLLDIQEVTVSLPSCWAEVKGTLCSARLQSGDKYIDSAPFIGFQPCVNARIVEK